MIDGFLPRVEPGDLAARVTRSGLRELGLPYASEPAITKHLERAAQAAYFASWKKTFPAGA